MADMAFRCIQEMDIDNRMMVIELLCRPFVATVTSNVCMIIFNFEVMFKR